MTLLPDVTVHQMLDAITATHVSVHSAYSATGANELAGGTYARVALTLGAAASRQKANSAGLTHNIPAGSTAAYLGLWTAITAGTFKGMMPIRGAAAVQGFGLVDTAGITSDTVTSNGHGLSVNNAVIFEKANNEALPAGLAVGTIYYVKTVPNVDTFTLSATLGGSTLDITGKGELYFMQIAPEVYASDGTLTTAIGALVIDMTSVAN